MNDITLDRLDVLADSLDRNYDYGTTIPREPFYRSLEEILTNDPEIEYSTLNSHQKLMHMNSAIGEVRRLLEKHYKYMLPPNDAGFYILLPGEHVKQAKKENWKYLRKSFRVSSAITESTNVEMLNEAERKELTDVKVSFSSLQHMIAKKRRKLGLNK